MDSNTQDALLYDAHKKSTGIAYLLWFLVGWSGAHYFYIGNAGLGVARLLLTIFTVVFFVLIFVSITSATVSAAGGGDSAGGLVGAALVFLILTIISGFVQFVWSIAEIFILHVMVTSRNLRVIEALSR